MDAIEIRRALAQDAGEILTLQRAAFVSEAQAYDDPFLPALTQTLDETRDDLRTTICLVAVLGTRIVGTIRARADGTTWRIGRLAVAPDQQGQGLGARLVHELESLAGAEITCFALFTGDRSLGNQRLYQRQGYVIVGHEPLPDGAGLTHLEKRR